MNMNMNNKNQFWNSSSSSPLFFEGDKKGETVLNSSVPVRMAFLRKVYGILSVQLAMTTLVSGLIMAMPSIQMFFIRKYVRINVKLISCKNIFTKYF
jgi:FtsH-binding integral membrane protein